MQELQAKAVARKAAIAAAKTHKARMEGLAAIKAGKSLNGSARKRPSIEDSVVFHPVLVRGN